MRVFSWTYVQKRNTVQWSNNIFAIRNIYSHIKIGKKWKWKILTEGRMVEYVEKLFRVYFRSSIWLRRFANMVGHHPITSAQFSAM